MVGGEPMKRDWVKHLKDLQCEQDYIRAIRKECGLADDVAPHATALSGAKLVADGVGGILQFSQGE